MSKTEIPSLRFHEFDDAWEQRKFEDAFAERREKTERENEDTLLSCAINGMFLNSELFGHFRGTTTIGYLRVKLNDLILSAQNLHLGNANVNLRFEHGIVSPAYKVYDLIDCNPEFVQAWVKKEDTKNFFLAATTEGASQCRKNIEWATLGKQTIAMPSLQEQTELGAFFTHLDNLITLHQRKLEKLTNVKKSMLEKMFPRNGSCYPEIRFKEFTAPWEQRKLGDCFTERVESMPDGELISVTINDGIKKFSELGRHDNSNDDKSKYKKVCVGDIAYNSMRMWQGASGYSSYEGIVSPAYTVLSPNSGINSKCLAYQFKLPEMIHTFQVNSQGITSDNWNLKYPALSQIEIFVSKDEQEQAKIAEYFENLDHLITLHQRELGKLLSIKKALLEKMFV